MVHDCISILDLVLFRFAIEKLYSFDSELYIMHCSVHRVNIRKSKPLKNPYEFEFICAKMIARWEARSQMLWRKMPPRMTVMTGNLP